jgi:hypothetical protein
MCVSWLISVYISILNPIRISWLRFLVYDYVCLIKKSKYIFTIKLQCNRGKSSLFDQFTPKLREKLPTVAIHKWKNLLFYTGDRLPTDLAPLPSPSWADRCLSQGRRRIKDKTHIWFVHRYLPLETHSWSRAEKLCRFIPRWETDPIRTRALYL